MGAAKGNPSWNAGTGKGWIDQRGTRQITRRAMTCHYAIESDNGMWTELVPVCGYNFHRRKKLTEDWREVDCQECARLSGFPVAEQLTAELMALRDADASLGDPMLRRDAA